MFAVEIGCAMSNLTPLEKLEVQILVDDVTDPQSSVPAYAESEPNYLMRTGRMPVAAGKYFCCAAHGFSCLVTAYRGTQKHTMLFDTGPEPYIFARNSQRLHADLGAIEGIVVSHGHFDHAGGALAALDRICEQNGAHPVPFHAHPDMFCSRALKMPNGTMLPLEDIPGPEALTAHGAQVIESTTPTTVLDDMFYISGEIPRKTQFEHGFPGHYRKTTSGEETADEENWEPDPLIMDERFLAVHVAGKGLVVFSGCSHAGIVNILHCARTVAPLHGIIGGLHLAGMHEPIIEQTVEAMREFRLHAIGVGHCTGWRAVHALATAFGDQVVAPCAVGER
jgi:7,8-dihydropterin-6-yl-methyl-4-(beta-D-ribofuranosyl)aminobenzene 5'-phosphate synthase